MHILLPAFLRFQTIKLKYSSVDSNFPSLFFVIALDSLQTHSIEISPIKAICKSACSVFQFSPFFLCLIFELVDSREENGDLEATRHLKSADVTTSLELKGIFLFCLYGQCLSMWHCLSDIWNLQTSQADKNSKKFVYSVSTESFYPWDSVFLTAEVRNNFHQTNSFVLSLLMWYIPNLQKTFPTKKIVYHVCKVNTTDKKTELHSLVCQSLSFRRQNTKIVNWGYNDCWVDGWEDNVFHSENKSFCYLMREILQETNICRCVIVLLILFPPL